MQTKLYLIVFVVVLIFSTLIYLKYPYDFREFLDVNTTNKLSAKRSNLDRESPKQSKKVKFLNTGLERVIDIDGNITDKPIYIDVG